MQAQQNAFGVLDWSVLIAYMALMVGIGVAASRREKNAETFFLANRSMPMWAVALSVLATSLSAATFIGAPQIAFAGDLTYLSLNIGTMMAAFIVAFLFVPPIYRAGTMTIYGYLGTRFGESAVTAASLMFLLGRTLASGVRHFMAGIGFALMLYGETSPRDLVFAILLLGAIGTLYTALGGVRAVIWTETIQMGVVVFAALLSIGLLLHAIPLSYAEILTALHDSPSGNKLLLIDPSFSLSKPYTLWAALLAATIMSTATYGVDHDLAQRVMTAQSPLRGGMALCGSILMGTPVVLLFLIIGLLLHIYYGRPDLMGAHIPWDSAVDTKRIYPQFLLNHMPSGLRGLAMAGLFSVAMSSFNSAINAMASTAVADLYGPWLRRSGRADAAEKAQSLRASRIGVVFMGGLLTAVAIGAIFAQQAGNETLIDFALGVMAFALAPLLGVFCTALFTRRGNPRSVYLSLGLGIVAVLLLQPYMLPQWLDFKLAWPWVWVVVAPFSFAVCAAGNPYESQN